MMSLEEYGNFKCGYTKLKGAHTANAIVQQKKKLCGVEARSSEAKSTAPGKAPSALQPPTASLKKLFTDNRAPSEAL